MKLKKIILEHDDGEEEIIDMPFDHISYEIDNGVYLDHHCGTFNPIISSNGQQRLILKAWTGRHLFEDFHTDDDRSTREPSYKDLINQIKKLEESIKKLTKGNI
jgi:hypothetical protein